MDGFIETILDRYHVLPEFCFTDLYTAQLGLNPSFDEFSNPENLVC